MLLRSPREPSVGTQVLQEAGKQSNLNAYWANHIVQRTGISYFLLPHFQA